MRITKVYTKTGDKGETRLVGGTPARKDDARVEAYGTVDELNAIVGLTRTFEEQDTEDSRLSGMLAHLQDDLFNVGTELATLPDDRWEGMYRVSDPDIERLEGWIDEVNDQLPPLEEFILPGGGVVGSFLHQARTVARRAERRVVSVGIEDQGLGDVLRYLNRFSDLMFVLGRWSAAQRGVAEHTWNNPRTRGR